jgi:hypothetical protein
VGPTKTQLKHTVNRNEIKTTKTKQNNKNNNNKNKTKQQLHHPSFSDTLL